LAVSYAHAEAPANQPPTPTHPHTHTYKPIRNILDPQREDGFPNGTRLESAGLRKRKGSEAWGLRWLESEGARLITVVSVFRAPSERAQPKLRLVYCAAQPFLGLLAPGHSGPGMWNPKATSPNVNVRLLTCSPNIIVLRLACSPNVRVRLLALSPNANDVRLTFHQLLLCGLFAFSQNSRVRRLALSPNANVLLLACSPNVTVSLMAWAPTVTVWRLGSSPNVSVLLVGMVTKWHHIPTRCV
jgi:hypothetical protein